MLRLRLRLRVRRSGGSQPTSLPSYADGTSWQYGELTRVSCPTQTFCIALGDGTYQFPQVLQGEWNGLSWSLAGVHTAAVRSQGFSAGGVSCVTATACYAVVESSNADTNSFAFGLVWNGRDWRLVSIPGAFNPHSDLLERDLVL